MFLTDLDNPKKEFFLELLILLLMSERVSDIEYDEVIDKSGKEPLLIPFSVAIDANALSILKSAADSIGESELIECIPDRFNNNPRSRQDNEFINRYEFPDYVTPFHDLRRSLVDNTKEKIDEYSSNSHVRQAVINEITQSGIDFFNINPKIIQIFTANLDQIRHEILLQTANAVAEKKKAEGIALTNREKKIYLYNLLFFCIKGKKDIDEKNINNLLKVITSSIEADVIYIQEFKPLIKQYIQIEQELVTLINE